MHVLHHCTITSTLRDAWVEVDLTALADNVAVIKSWLRPSESAVQLMAVVKSDGYGHGAEEAAATFLGAGARWLGVATLEEAMQLRRSQAKAPLLILAPAPARGLATALEYNVDLTVTSNKQIKDVSAAAKAADKRARVHLKVDTGMHRLGVPTNQLIELVDEIRTQRRLHLVSIFSHLAKPDDSEFTHKQNDAFVDSLFALSMQRPDVRESVFAHLASGEAARRFPITHHDMVRVGLYLYGLQSRVVSDVVRPAMSVRARINQVRLVNAGEGIGYNLTWSSSAPARVASIPIGYADGVQRGLSNKMSGLLKGKLVPQAGTISMDQMLFDVTAVPEACEGDVITLIGSDGDRQIHLADWAQMLDTVTYEMACGLRVRLPRIYTRSQDST